MACIASMVLNGSGYPVQASVQLPTHNAEVVTGKILEKLSPMLPPACQDTSAINLPRKLWSGKREGLAACKSMHNSWQDYGVSAYTVDRSLLVVNCA